MKNARTLLAAGIAVAILVAVTGCGPANVGDPDGIGKQIEAALNGHEASGEMTLDLADFGSGEWTRILVVCMGSDRGQVNELLGFDWEAMPDLRNSNFLAMLVFATDAEVVSFYSAGQDDFSSDLYVTPCSYPADRDGRSYPPPFQLARTSSEVTFVFEPGTGYWYVPYDELEEMSQS